MRPGTAVEDTGNMKLMSLRRRASWRVQLRAHFANIGLDFRVSTAVDRREDVAGGARSNTNLQSLRAHSHLAGIVLRAVVFVLS